ncbi:MAG: class I SAM-dependent methyltransferase [Nitrospirota bacterium]
MLETIPCNLCSGSDTELLFGITDNSTGLEQKFNLVRCRSCDLVYVNPRPIRDVISRYYPQDSYYAYHFQDQNTLKRRIRNYVLEAQGGYAHSGKDDLFVRVIGKMLATLTRNQILMFAPSLPNGKALDVGCGCGDLLLWLQGHGWGEVRGVELSPGAADLANKNGLNVFCGELINANYPDRYFDFITLNHVLEHVHDPMQTLKEIHRILKPDGLLVVGVPNFGSFENIVFGRHQSILKEVPRHLYHFSRQTMTRMLDQSGFTVARTAGKTFFIPSVNRQSLRIIIENESKAKFLRALYRISVERPFRYLLSREKEAFGQLFTFYVNKKR